MHAFVVSVYNICRSSEISVEIKLKLDFELELEPP